MSKRKREGNDISLEHGPPDLNILVAGRDGPLTAHRNILSVFSAVVRDLPIAADGGLTTWDLRDVTLEGESQPVSVDVVQTWLDIIYSKVDDTRSGSPPSRLQDCVRLLKLADFTATCRPVMRDIASKFAADPGAFLDVAIPQPPPPPPPPADQAQQPQPQQQQRGASLKLHDAVYAIQTQGLCELQGWADILTPVESSEFRSFSALLRAAATEALESALYLAARLQLSPLSTLLRGFAKAQMVPHKDHWVLTPGGIYTPRVLHALPREVLYEGFLESSFINTSARIGLAGDVEGIFTLGPMARYLDVKPGARVPALQLKMCEDQEGVSLIKLQTGNCVAVVRVITAACGLSAGQLESLVREAVANAASEGT